MNTGNMALAVSMNPVACLGKDPYKGLWQRSQALRIEVGACMGRIVHILTVALHAGLDGHELALEINRGGGRADSGCTSEIQETYGVVGGTSNAC